MIETVYTVIQFSPLPNGGSVNCTETAPPETTEAEAVVYFEQTLEHLREKGITGTLSLQKNGLTQRVEKLAEAK